MSFEFWGFLQKNQLEDNMFNRLITLAMVFAFSLSLMACGPSRELRDLQMQYDALQRAPLTSQYVYQVSKPFILMGKLVRNGQELAAALATRPMMVVATVNTSESFAVEMCQADMQNVGYKLLGKTKKGLNVELAFQTDPSFLQAAQAQRQQQLNVLQQQINNQRQADAQSRQTGIAVGVPLALTAVGIAISVVR